MKSLLALILCIACGLGFAKTIDDRPLEFSAVVPDQARVEVAENEKGRSVTVVHQDPVTHEAFTIQAVRANNGGFNATPASVFTRMMEGASSTIGKPPSLPLRTLRYAGFELHVAQHEGVGVNASQTLTTIVFLQERGTWRKVITVQFLTRGVHAPSDEILLDKLKSARFRPAA
jgi:hypothetical protein